MNKTFFNLLICTSLSITFSSNVIADTWSFPIEAVETVYEFGETRIVKTVDGRVNNEYPDFIIDI